MKFEVKHRWNSSVLFSVECGSLREAVVEAAKQKADLRCAYLSDANLRGAYLRCAYLSGANLRRADLSGAYLRCANLRCADLSDADLSDADLSDANLSGAYLSGAYLSGANLRRADLSGAYLSDANLTPIRDDVWAVLSSCPAEVPALRAAIAEGRVDGSTYTGDCACLVGTLPNARGCEFDELAAVKPNAGRPAEQFFLGIAKGDTPATNQFSAIALAWVDEWLANVTNPAGDAPAQQRAKGA